MKTQSPTGKRLKRTSIAALVIGLACSAHAATQQVESLTNSAAQRVLLHPGYAYAPTFQTGAEATVLDSIVLSIGLSIQIDPFPDTYTTPIIVTSLFKSDTNGMPNMAEPVLTQSFVYDSSEFIANQIVSLRLSPPQPVRLEPGTTYSFIISATYTGVETGILLVAPASPSSNGYRKPEGGDWNLQQNIMHSTDGGQTYTNETPDGGFYPAFAVYTTPVPEPSTYALIGAGLALAAVAISRRRR